MLCFGDNNRRSTKSASLDNNRSSLKTLLEEENTRLRSNKRSISEAEKLLDSQEISNQIGKIVKSILAEELAPFMELLKTKPQEPNASTPSCANR